MLLIRTVAAFTLLASNCAQAAQETTCPAFVSDKGLTHPLDDASVFDGPPSELADLIPVNGGWDLSSYKDNPRPMFMVCKYRHSNVTRTVEIHKGSAGCKVYEHAGATKADCA